MENLSDFILLVKYINCSKCDNYEVEESDQEGAEQIFIENGWTCKEVVLCPGCSNGRPTRKDEIERLKGLVKDQWNQRYDFSNKENDLIYPKEHYWNKFKTKNNL